MRFLRLATVMTAIVALVILSGTAASAQPGPPPSGQGYYGTPPGGPAFPMRNGLTLGMSLGIGDMSAESGPIECFDCSYNPGAVAFDFHIGGMLNPRLALLFELWFAGKTLDSVGNELLLQTMAMAAAQTWVTPRLWLKGGLGLAHLSYSYDDGYYADEEPIADGVAVMGAVGYDILVGPRFALDLQLRLGVGSYDGIGDSIQTGVFGVGFSWY